MNIVRQDKEKVAKAPDLKEVIGNVKKMREHLKIVFRDKKDIKNDFINKLKQLQKQIKENEKKIEENEKWFNEKWQELEKLEIRSILWWDFWRREIEINRLQRQAGIGTLPSEREKIEEEIKRINNYNMKIEEGFKGGRVDAEIIARLRKELEEELKKEEEED